MNFLEELAARRRFGMKPGLDSIRAVCSTLGDPQKKFKTIHVAGTNGKGAVCAILDAALGNLRTGESSNRRMRVGRYTSPHLVKINERFFLDGAPVSDEILERAASKVASSVSRLPSFAREFTFFEALTAVAFELYAEANVDYAVLECGLGGRLDATNVCNPALCVITKIGLDHCDWLGETVEKIAAEKAGIVKPGVPVVLGRNEPSVVDVVRRRADEVGAPFHYAPDLASESEIPTDFSLAGSFNRENAVTALAAWKVLSPAFAILNSQFSISHVVWPGRFQRVGDFIVDGAHNPPAARALVEALTSTINHQPSTFNLQPSTFNLICGFCGDKDVGEVLSILAPLVRKGYAVRTNNPRSLSAEETAARMQAAGIDAVACPSLRAAIQQSGLSQVSQPSTFNLKPSTFNLQPSTLNLQPSTVICGSLFLAGEALVELGAYPWKNVRFDPSETLKVI